MHPRPARLDVEPGEVEGRRVRRKGVLHRAEGDVAALGRQVDQEEMVDEFKRFLDRVSPDEFASEQDD